MTQKHVLTDEEIQQAINDAPLTHSARSFVLAVGRAIEAAAAQTAPPCARGRLR